jgi:hypothetical protein
MAALTGKHCPNHRVDGDKQLVGRKHMRPKFFTVLLATCFVTSAAWAQTSSSGGVGSSTGGTAPSTSSATSPRSATLPLPQSDTGMQANPAQGSSGVQTGPVGQIGETPSGADEAANARRDTLPSGSATEPVSPPGTEGSTGGIGGGSPATTGGIGGQNRQPGRASVVPPSSREEDLLIEGERLEQKARRSLCVGC